MKNCWLKPNPTRRRSASLLALFVIAAFAAGACDPPPSGPQRYLDPVFGSTMVADLAYGSAVDEHGATETLKLDLFTPSGDTAPVRPAIVFVHGGGFVGGDKAGLRNEAKAYADRGYVTVSINYRLREGAAISFDSPTLEAVLAVADAQHDAQAAVRWLRRHAAEYRIDPGRIAMYGVSAGAVTSLGVAFNPDNVGTSGNPGYSSRICLAVSVVGALIPQAIDPSDSRVLMLNGALDTTVPPSFSRPTADAAAAAGLLDRYVEFADSGHSFTAASADTARLFSIDALRRHLVVDHPAGCT